MLSSTIVFLFFLELTSLCVSLLVVWFAFQHAFYATNHTAKVRIQLCMEIDKNSTGSNTLNIHVWQQLVAAQVNSGWNFTFHAEPACTCILRILSWSVLCSGKDELLLSFYPPSPLSLALFLSLSYCMCLSLPLCVCVCVSLSLSLSLSLSFSLSLSLSLSFSLSESID